MTRDLLIVSERALTASDLAAGVAAVHQGLPWQVTNEGDRLAVMQHGQVVEELSVPDLREGRVKHPHTRELRDLMLALEEV